MIAEDDDFVLDVTRDNCHGVPDRGDLLVNCLTKDSMNYVNALHIKLVPLLTNRTVGPSLPFSICFKRTSAFAHEIGKLGIVGLLAPSTLVLFSYEG
jgi:hypothetical protein